CAVKHRTMSRAAATEMMPLDQARKSAPLAGPDHMNEFIRVEDVDHHFVSRIRSVVTLKRNFTDKPYRCSVVLFKVPRHWLVYPLGFHKLDEAKLHGIVTVLLFRLLLNDDAGPGLDNRYRNDRSVILQQLRHPDFLTE